MSAPDSARRYRAARPAIPLPGTPARRLSGPASRRTTGVRSGRRLSARRLSARREPAGLAHVHAGHAAVAGTAQRRALFQVTGQRFALVAGQERTVGVDHPPPGHSPAPLRHHPPDLARARFTEVLGDVPVGHHPPRRDAVGNPEYPFGEVGRVAGHHGPDEGQVSSSAGGRPSARPPGRPGGSVGSGYPASGPVSASRERPPGASAARGNPGKPGDPGLVGPSAATRNPDPPGERNPGNPERSAVPGPSGEPGNSAAPGVPGSPEPAGATGPPGGQEDGW